MMNPVLRREAVTSLRGWKNFAVLTFYLGVTALGAGLVIYAGMFDSWDFSFDPQVMTVLYVVLAAVQMALITLTVPALTAGSISGERERQTLDLLLVTKMSSFSIVMGKLLASLAFILLLIVGTLPVLSLVFYFGGIKISAVLLMVGFMLMTALMLGSISVFFSCIFKRTVVSIMLVYIIMGVLCLGTILAAVLPLAVRDYNAVNMINLESEYWRIALTLIPNPGVAFFSLVDAQLGSNIVTRELLSMLNSKNSALNWIVENIWMMNMLFDAAVTALFIALSCRAINPVREHRHGGAERKPKKERKKGKKKEAV